MIAPIASTFSLGERQSEGRPLLTENFAAIASAPNGIKKLRKLINELALAGRLVPLCNALESDQDFMERVSLERDSFLAVKGFDRVRRQPQSSNGVDESCDAPAGWKCVVASDIFVSKSGNSKLIKGKLHDQPTSALFAGYSASGQDVWLDSWEHEGTAIILSAVGARCGKAFLAEGKWSAIANTHIIWPLLGVVDKRFAMLMLNNEEFWIRSGGAQPFVKVKETLGRTIALPSLDVQRQIVSKVDELMALCDQLEAQQADAEAAHEKLVRELLATLTQSQSAADFQSNWQRLATHFDTLFTTESSIDGLESAIRQLAIVGRLAPQNANEEPADRLIARIAAQKERLVAEGKIREGKSRTELESGQGGGDLPFGWVRTTVGDVTICRDGERVPISQSERDGREKIYDYYGASGVIDKIDGFLFDKPLLLIGEDGANLINRSTPIAFIARGQYWVNNHAHVLDGISEDLLKYVELYFNAIDLKPYVTGTAQPKMNQAKMNGIPIALPPESEQKRIVSKVRDLMAICSQLRSQLIQARGLNQQLANALVEQVLV